MSGRYRMDFGHCLEKKWHPEFSKMRSPLGSAVCSGSIAKKRMCFGIVLTYALGSVSHEAGLRAGSLCLHILAT